MNQTPPKGLVLCLDHSEARILRQRGWSCITHAKLRRQLVKILNSGAPNAAQVASTAIGGIDAVTDAADPATWTMWGRFCAHDPAIDAAFKGLPIIPTPLVNPIDVTVLQKGVLWGCETTTVLVAQDTLDLVAVADTYAHFNIYRPRGRMDEPITPQRGNVCLVTADELKLLRFGPSPDADIVFTYTPHQNMTGMVATPHNSESSTWWPTPIRAICGEHPEIRIGVAPWCVFHRSGRPFFLGLCRGYGFQTPAKTDPLGTGAMDYCIETDQVPASLNYDIVIWHGGDDILQLIRYGGLTIFTGGGKRRKVQLKGLGLIRAGRVAGMPIYNLEANQDTLRRWTITRTFDKPEPSMKQRDRSRVRSQKRGSNPAGGHIIYIQSPCGIRPPPSKKANHGAKLLRNHPVGIMDEDCGVATVRLKTLSPGHTYFLNGRAKEKGEDVIIDPKRCVIRCPLWMPREPEGLLKALKESPVVVMAGRNYTRSGEVFAIIRVANGTEDQQQAGVCEWCEEIGRRFPHAGGFTSWIRESVTPEYLLTLSVIDHKNWNAESLPVAQFERYKLGGDYGTPIKMKRGGVATATERALLYAERVEGLDCEGERNRALASALLNIRDKFGAHTLDTVEYVLLGRSTLPEKEKRKLFNRIRRCQ